MSKLQDKTITLAHGNGGRYMRELIEDLFKKHLANDLLDTDADATTLPTQAGELLITTDGFTVNPLEFPGGNIGSLAIHGTVNDLSVAGATPLYLTLNAFIEEGMSVEQLDRILTSMASAAEQSGVKIVAGDTKVLPHGQGSGVYFATTGVGVKSSPQSLSMSAIKPGDKILISGSVGDHGTAVMLAREQFGLSGELQSDAASVHPYTQALYELPGLRFMRDPTRGGLAQVLFEVAHATGYRVNLQQEQIPVKDPVASICEMLGYDPYYLACEGRVVAIVAEEDAEQALSIWQSLSSEEQPAIVGDITADTPQVILHTPLGGQRPLEELEDDPLPRIC